MVKNNKKDIDWLLRILKIINLIIIPIIIPITGWYVTSRIEKANRDNTKIIEQTQSRISQIQAISDFMPYLTNDKGEVRLMAVKSISMLLDSNLSIKLGLNVLTDKEFLDLVNYFGIKAKPVLQNVANQTNNKKVLNTARNGLKQLNIETFVFKITNDPYSSVAYDTFRTGKIFANLKVSEQLESILIDWGEDNESFNKQNDLQYLYEKDGWYNYSIDHRFKKPGLKKIKAKVVFQQNKKEYTNENQIYIEAL